MRKYLPKEYKLQSPNHAKKYIIVNVRGCGSSAVVYDARCEAAGKPNKCVILKECYPTSLSLMRDESYRLCCKSEDLEKFKERKLEFVQSGKTQNEIGLEKNCTNSTPTTWEVFDANNTKYLVCDFAEGNTLKWHIERKELSLLQKAKICHRAAALVSRYHENGYLCLDIKPSNLFVMTNESGEIVTDLIRYIDFDSVKRKDEISFGNSLSYTKAWAAPEQINPYSYTKICEATDVYAIGELVFWCFFGRHSIDREHRSYSVYPFGEATDADDKKVLSRIAVQNILSELFHSTLRSAVCNRFQSMAKAITLLKELVREVGKEDVIVSRVPTTTRNFVGREKEIADISKIMGQEDLLFIVGMGGIGKSTLIKNYCAHSKRNFDEVVYLEYRGSTIDTFIDDKQFSISTMQALPSESASNYFDRKLRRFKEITKNRRILMVWDNFDGKADIEFKQIRQCDWKIIVGTRVHPPKQSVCVYYVKELESKSDQYRLIENSLGRKIAETERCCVDEIISNVKAHTLVLELIGKQVTYGHLSLMKAAQLARENGFTNIAKERVDYIKDDVEHQNTVAKIISALFDAGQLPRNERIALKIVSCFEPACIGITVLQDLLSLETMDVYNQLAKEGWVVIENNTISLHPVILEAVRQWDWDSESENAIVSIMKKLWVRIKIEYKKEDVPKRLVDMYKAARKNPTKLNECWSSMVHRAEKQGKKDYIIEATYRRTQVEVLEAVTDYDKLSDDLNVAESLLKGVGKIKSISETELYFDLLYITAFAAPPGEEDFVLRAYEKLAPRFGQSNPVPVIRISDKALDIYAKRKKMECAEAIVQRLDGLFPNTISNYANALYFDLSANYYDDKLDGVYDAQTKEEKKYYNSLMDNLNRAIRYLHLSRDLEAKMCLAQCFLSKACIQIRVIEQSGEQIKKKEKEKILKLLQKSRELIEREALKHAELWINYYMVMARYYTVVEPDMQSTNGYVAKAIVIASRTCQTKLDYMEMVWIPFADMMTNRNFQRFDLSLVLLQKCVEICEEYPDAEPYIREKMDLLSHMMDVYYDMGDMDGCKKVLGVYDQENQRITEIGIPEIPIQSEKRAVILNS